MERSWCYWVVEDEDEDEDEGSEGQEYRGPRGDRN
jgi:hypothetical protein